VVFPRGERECEVIFDYFLEEEFIQNDLIDDSGEEQEEGPNTTNIDTHTHASTESTTQKERQATNKPTLSSFIHTSLLASDKVQEEDTYLCENVQLGLESGEWRHIYTHTHTHT
jgi:hypothetical protein